MADYDWIQRLLYETGGRRRFTQNTPILPDVWEEYARKGDVRVDVLITPHQSRRGTPLPPTQVAEEIRMNLGKMHREKLGSVPSAPAKARKLISDTKLAANQTHVAAALTFEELIRVVLPLSRWWINQIQAFVDGNAPSIRTFIRHLTQLDKPASRSYVSSKLAVQEPAAFRISEEFFWLMQVISRLGWRMQSMDPEAAQRQAAPQEQDWNLPPLQHKAKRQKYFERALDILNGVMDFKSIVAGEAKRPLIHAVSINRKAELCLHQSVRTIKADAVKNLFQINCSTISWAVVDSGIDARHVAFRKIDSETGKLHPLPALADEAVPRRRRRAAEDVDWTNRTRVVATYDFTFFRDLISEDDNPNLSAELRRLFRDHSEKRAALKHLLLTGKALDWELFLPFIRVPHNARYTPPTNSHGTHVAGIIGAGYTLALDPQETLPDDLIGVCPDINLIDLRVFRDGSEGEEFNIMAALQFLHHLNSHNTFQYLHGVNLSLSLRHDVRNYACGRTPICEECERLIGAGIVVVAAAGNEGFNKELNDGFATGKEFRSVSITDPGNAEAVITVGSTHANEPHNYGISYFSSRGPTGDGRLKPDLVAPGEKITSAVIGDAVEEMDGTSMAAPHVSGAAAMILARHTEFIGRPRKIKDLLCRTATDLGRLPDYQGRGLVDILRALQDV